MDPDEFAAVVEAVLSELEPPRLNDAQMMAVFLEEAATRVAAVYRRRRRRRLFGVRAVAAVYGVEPRWLATFATNEFLSGSRKLGRDRIAAEVA